MAIASSSSGDLYVLAEQSSHRYTRGSFVAALSPSGELDSGFGENGSVFFPTAVLGPLETACTTPTSRQSPGREPPNRTQEVGGSSPPSSIGHTA